MSTQTDGLLVWLVDEQTDGRQRDRRPNLLAWAFLDQNELNLVCRFTGVLKSPLKQLYVADATERTYIKDFAGISLCSLYEQPSSHFFNSSIRSEICSISILLFL